MFFCIIEKVCVLIVFSTKEENLNILEYFPNKIVQAILNSINEKEIETLEEIRIRVSKPIILKLANKEIIVEYIVTTQDILEIVEKITENSMYSYQQQICSGYITLKGGHRVGISGNVVMEENKVINVNYIYSLNFRIARQIIGVADKVVNEVIKNDEVSNTLIISKPGAGKTTILRDLIRIISKIKTVGVVDERGEIAAMYKNEPQNDLGIKVDILSNISKSLGIKMLVRSMAPDVIVADEIGTKKDIEAIKYAVTSGVKGIFTAHANNIEDIKKSPILKELLDLNLIDKIIILDKNNRENIETSCSPY